MDKKMGDSGTQALAAGTKRHDGKTLGSFPYRMEAEQWQQEQSMKGETARHNQMEQPSKRGAK